MSYYPYFRGKQNELLTIKELASLLSRNNFVPIVEPVKKELNSLKRSLDAISENNGQAIVIVNPQIGVYKFNGEPIEEFLIQNYGDRPNIKAGLLLTDEMSAQEVVLEVSSSNINALIHYGFSDARTLAPLLTNQNSDLINIFIEDFCGRLYRRHFRGMGPMILIRDGYEKRVRNRDHPLSEFFSDLHATYEEEGMNGFGDFLIVGDNYSERGGPAYTIAIHITYIDNLKDDEMHIFHFKSERQDTPKDPAGKFAEALDKLVTETQRPATQILHTEAIQEFIDLHAIGHFPGLGYVKKLSMKNHIQILAHYLR